MSTEWTMPRRPPARDPVTTLQEMETALHQLLRKRMGRRYEARRSRNYRMCELWSMDSPPNELEYTPMANRLDRLVGFALTEVELWKAYDMDLICDSALYLFNVMRAEQDGQKVIEKKKSKRKA